MTTNTQEIYKALPEFMRFCIKEQIELATTEELAEAQKRLDKRKAQIVAGVVLDIQKHLQMETMNDKVIITIKLDK